MPALDDTVRSRLALLASRQQRRAPRQTERFDGVTVVRDGRRLISFSCNDYLGLTHHPEVVEAGVAALRRYGAGAGASRLVTGDHPLYQKLEAALAAYKGTEAACVFGSGYLASFGVIPTLLGKSDLILADRLIHACMLDAARLSGATLLRFAHNNVAHARMLLEEYRADSHHCMILTETVFSMDGDLAPLDGLAELALHYDAWLLTDDAHGLGVVTRPAAGQGGQAARAPLQMGTLSKALGSYGGYVCASQEVADYLKSAARSLIYSTALPPAAVGAAVAALRVLTADRALCEAPLLRARQFTALAGLPEAQSPIVPLILKDTERALKASALLDERGFLAAAIRPPSVPEQTARLRFAFTALHTEAQVEELAGIVVTEGWGEPCEA